LWKRRAPGSNHFGVRYLQGDADGLQSETLARSDSHPDGLAVALDKLLDKLLDNLLMQCSIVQLIL
jgi:hypothetical protein